MNASPAWELERYLPLLRVYARQVQLHPRLRRRFDASDLVNDAFVRALKGLAGCRAQTEGELVAWLEQILTHVAIDKIRAAQAGGRHPRLETYLHMAIDESSIRMQELVARGPSPSSAAANHELQLRVAAAIDRLPEDQRDAVILRDLYREPLVRIAEHLGKSERAVAGLLRRGHHRLRELLPDLR
jgi:RNA polymerase sigma-70 factor (ECF subfamily)